MIIANFGQIELHDIRLTPDLVKQSDHTELEVSEPIFEYFRIYLYILENINISDQK